MEAKTYPSAQEMKYYTWEHSCRAEYDELIEQGVLTKVTPFHIPAEDGYETLLELGFEKVYEDGGSYEHCICLNPKTKEVFRVLEWDYDDVRVDDNAYRAGSINYESEAFKMWWDLVYRDRYEREQRLEAELAEQRAKEPKVGDKAIVVKGRTLPKGTSGVVTKIWYFQASYYNRIAYALLDGDKKIALKNLEKCNV